MNQLRLSIAMEAARIITENQASDFHSAKRKAISRLGIEGNKHLPSNQEIETALINYQQLFHHTQQSEQLQILRQSALQAMKFFKSFEPRLVGSILSGSALAHAGIHLHLFTDSPEEVSLFLDQQQIPFHASNKPFRISHKHDAHYPCYQFIADDTPVELVVFPLNGLRQAPLSSLDNKPMNRASIKKLMTLINDL